MSRSPASGVEWEQSNDDDYKSFLTSKQLHREHAKVVDRPQSSPRMLKSWTGHRAVHAMKVMDRRQSSPCNESHGPATEQSMQ